MLEYKTSREGKLWIYPSKYEIELYLKNQLRDYKITAFIRQEKFTVKVNRKESEAGIR